MLATLALSVAGVWYAREQAKFGKIQVEQSQASAARDVGVIQKQDTLVNATRERLAARQAHLLTRNPEAGESTKILRRKETLEQAVAKFRGMVAAHPEDIVPYAFLAINLMNLGKNDEARSVIDESIRRFPNDVRPRTILAELLLQIGDPVGARKAAEEAVERDPRLGQAHAVLGVSLDRLGFDGSALDALHTAIKLDPTLAIAHQRLGLIWLRSSDYQQAEDSFTTALELDQSVTNTLALASTLLAEGRRADAIVALKSAQALAPTQFMADAKDYKPDLSAALITVSPELDELCGRFLLSTRDLQPGNSLEGHEVALLRALRGTTDRKLFVQVEDALIDLCIVPQFVDQLGCYPLRVLMARNPPCLKAGTTIIGFAMTSHEVLLPAAQIPCRGLNPRG